MKIKYFFLIISIITSVSLISGCKEDRDNPSDYINFETVASPDFSPAPGSYDHDINVEITCDTTDAEIYYTTDDSLPTKGSPIYSSGISVVGHGATIKIMAMAARAMMNDSTVITAEYTIDYNRVSRPEFSLESGTYHQDVSVEISCSTEDSTIYYTTDSNDPTIESNEYSGPISVSGHGTVMEIRAIAVKDQMLDSEVVSATYEIEYDTQVITPTFNPYNSSGYSSQKPFDVEIECATSDATIYYTTTITTDGSEPADPADPTETSDVYTSPISLVADNTKMKIKAFAVKSQMLDSEIRSAFYEVHYDQVSTPQFVPLEGTYNEDRDIVIACSTEDANIYYTIATTTNGDDPGDPGDPLVVGTPYAGSIEVHGHNNRTRINAVAKCEGCPDAPLSDSTIASAYYIILDNVRPAVTSFVVSPGDELTNNRNITFTLAGDDDDAVTGGVVGWLINESPATPDPDDVGWMPGTPIPSSYELSTGDGVKTVFAWAKDEADNVSISTSNSQFSVVLDQTPPTVEITSSETSPTSSDPIPVTITFSEEVTGFVVGDISVGNGVASNLLTPPAPDPDNNVVFTVDIEPDGDGTVTVNISDSVAQDLAGNGNIAASEFSILYDGNPPTVTGVTPLTLNDSDVGAVNVTITFSESMDTSINPSPTISGLARAYIITGSSWGNGNTVWSGTFMFVDDDEDATGTYNISGFTDVAGNVMSSDSSNTVSVDTQNPTVTGITPSSLNDSDVGVVNVTITFSESMNTSINASPTISGLARAYIVSGSSWDSGNTQWNGTFTFVDDDEEATGTYNISDFTDAAGNVMSSDSSNTVSVDTMQPTVSISSSESSPTNNNPFPVTITFSEVVSGFAVGDISVGNGSAGNFNTSDNIVYTVDITPSGDPVTVDIGGGVCVDLAGNSNTAAGQFSIAYDGIAPTVSISSSESSPTNSNPIPVMITFSEVVSGFAVGDISVGNGSAGNFNTSDNIVYTVDITPS
ncbi:MAG: chitobiase/beta-hexosaminidase C-terminal domain-containing protein, partial [Spirochaetota bacterium]|nr:chitobiase/beta-hexosaminidase C-terminal domain-containing protein [Spirochaetota bacterium]